MFLDDRSDLALRNVLDPSVRGMLLGMSAAFGVLSAVCGIVYVLGSRRSAPVLHLDRLTRLAAPLLMSAAVPNVFAWRVYQDRDFMFCVVATLFGLATERCFRTSLTAWQELGLPSAIDSTLSRARFLRSRAQTFGTARAVLWLRQHAACAVLAALVVAFGIYIGVHAVRQQYQLKTYSWD